MNSDEKTLTLQLNLPHAGKSNVKKKLNLQK